ncbi:hypothetical protein IM792_07225 [Mucilaginibacter sp. JRF]|uniref:hypothetical protein n=1 Tax=Mucilaginibacter sp. JRF TaxID=2780088 RepID=UPI00187DE008|nr:hypothetical protein [Mucilaginibacter sp. JRF]MBE9584232.1 hypothetical protein [Mucilaginibacter sp. JRF]
MRALAIAPHLNVAVTFLGSGLREYEHNIPSTIRCIHLPPDIPGLDDVVWDEISTIDSFHYAPLNIAGIRLRNQILSDFFVVSYPMLLVIDVSVEIALFARLSGIPTIIVRQHGKRNDPAHLAAYQSASLLLAPYAAKLSSECLPWVDQKTFFSGGFSKFTTAETIVSKMDNISQVAVMTGKGGTSINITFIEYLAKNCPLYHFHIIGELPSNKLTFENITFHGSSNDPGMVLELCNTVIGNAGHNTVMEIADLKKAFICIPEKRPFDEQLQKAQLIKQYYNIPVVLPADLFTTDWNTLLYQVGNNLPDWQGMITEQALSQISIVIDELANKVFRSKI